jgi:hypothetical protein
MRVPDPVVSPLSTYARLRRKEHSLDRGVRKSVLRALQRPFRLWDLGVELPGLSDEGAQQAAEERSELLDALRGRVDSSANGTKFHTGPLSPGCVICQNGDWDCNLLNRR